MTSISGLTSSALMKAQMLVQMQKQMNDLSLQLSTGKLTQSYAGLGIDRGLDVNVRGAMSRLGSYEDVISTVNTRVQLQTTSLEQLRTLQQDMRSSMLPPLDFTLTANGQTTAQIQAGSSFAEALDALNQRAGSTYLFSGAATNTPATDTADHIMNGNGTAAGFKQIVAERLEADQGADQRGRLDAPAAAGDAVTLSEQNSGPFGFKIAGATTTIPGATVTGPAGSPASLSIDLNGNNPADGAKVIVQLNMPDGTQKTITLTASSETPPPSGSFAIGATADDTAANIAGALDGAIQTAGKTDLVAASAMAASNDFFNIDADHPPQRVSGTGPFYNATSLRDATATDTVRWYTGDDATGDPRASMTARVDDAITVSYGVRGNEEAIRNAVQNFATLAVMSFSGSDPDAHDRYVALTQRAGDNLAANPAKQQISAIETQIAGANVSANAAQQRIDDRKPILQGILDDIENVDPNEIGVKLLAMQTQIQASMQTTAMLSKLTLVNFMG
ncbi:MAG TPA: flagellar biosynthesis protein FlgL [Xanthobacteraceae bacterium]|jgi:flagellin-like hook-associated protein FlgL|nr:flagellar biosynthesis protein FlgL [Xanthobacteraceae bacterium]